MKKFSPKEIDEVLNAFYCEPSAHIKPKREIIDILCADGYIAHKQEGKTITYYITDKGKGFIHIGGYTEEAKRRMKRLITNIVITTIASAIGAIIGAIVLEFLL